MVHPIINLFRTEWKNLTNRKKSYLLYNIFFVIARLVDLATPLVIGSIFNSIQGEITSQAELNMLIFKICLLLIITVVFWVFHGTARVLEQLVGFHIRRNYSNDKVMKVLELPIKWHKDNHSGDTIDKISRASDSLYGFSSELVYNIIYGVIGYVASLIIMFFIDWRIGLFATVFSILVLFIIFKFDKNLNSKYLELNKYSNKYFATLFDYISNVITVITLRLKKTVRKEIDIKGVASYHTFKNTRWVNELKWFIASMAISLMTVIALVYHATTEFRLTGTILIGTLYMLYSYLENVGQAFYKFAWLYGDVVSANARIIGAEPIEEEYAKVEAKKHGRLDENWKVISLKDVSFRYDNNGKIKHIDNINFTFKRKQKIALVGESGSGKSTILTLIRGLYDIDEGEIYVDAQKIENGLQAVKSVVTLIPQEPEIFNNTFRYNITMDLPTRKEDLNKVIEMSQLKPVLEKLPNKLDTNIMEKGVSLSGGEKQRLALARGLLSAFDSDIVLLDEPTSSVDSMNEVKIHEHLFSNFKNKTIIASIHRLHLLDRFDYIYLFSKGQIIGQGTFEEIKRDPYFAKLSKKYKQEKGN